MAEVVEAEWEDLMLLVQEVHAFALIAVMLLFTKLEPHVTN